MCCRLIHSAYKCQSDSDMVSRFGFSILLVSAWHPVDTRAEEKRLHIISSPKHLQDRTSHLVHEQRTYTYSTLMLRQEVVSPILPLILLGHLELSGMAKNAVIENILCR